MPFPFVNAGSFRHSVAIQTDGGTQDSVGQITPSWSTQVTRWAAIEPLTGVEYLSAQQLQADITHRIMMRYDATLATHLTPKARILFGSRVFEIVSVRSIDELFTVFEAFARETVA